MATQTPDVGSRIRGVRQQQHLSLLQVSESCGVSVATLSRIETSKQSINVELLVTIAEMLGVAPAELLGTADKEAGMNMLVERFAALRNHDRVRVMNGALRRGRDSDPAAIIEELLSTVDVIRDQLSKVARATRKRRKS